MAFFDDGNERFNKPREEEEDIDLDFDDDEDEGGGEKGAPAWLASYSDMMTDLMAIFVILFAFAMMSTSHENQNIKEELQDVKHQMEMTDSGGGSGGYQLESEFDEIFELIKAKINESGYSDSVHLQKYDGYFTFRFKDNVLFYPDSPVMRESSFDILEYIGDLLMSVEQGIHSIEISGFTAKVGDTSATNFFSWELSSNRAITVLKFFSTECELPLSKMSIAGYSHHRPIAENDTEDGRSLNRRVEVKVSRKRVVDNQTIEVPE